MPSGLFPPSRFTFRTATENDLDVLVRFRVEFVCLYKTLNDHDRTKLAADTEKDFRNGMQLSRIRFWVACFEAATGENESCVLQVPAVPPFRSRETVPVHSVSGRPVNLSNQTEARILASVGLMNLHGQVELMGVYTEPEWRNHGLASHLVRVVIEECKRLGYSRITLQPTDQSVSIYRKAGFQDQGGRMILFLDRM